MLERQIERLEVKLHLSELDRAKREERDRESRELEELLRQNEEHRRWLEKASVEELQEAKRKLIEEHEKDPHKGLREELEKYRADYRPGMKLTPEEMAQLLPQYEDMFFEGSLGELDMAIKQREARRDE